MNNEALTELDIEYVLQDEGIDYKDTWGRSGRQLNVKTCPFCGNNKYKVYMNAVTGLGNCFAGSCSQGNFNKWVFLTALYDLNPKDLQAKINLMAIQQGWRPKEEYVKFDPGELNLPSCTPCAELPAMPRYLMNRGITADIAQHFDLRLCESGWFSVDDPTGKTIKQNYANRIIIPVFNLQGEMVSFQGRDTTGEAEKRYLFPPMFSGTGSQLYNIQNWRPGMDTVIITEGPFDAVGAYKAIRANKLEDKYLATASFGMNFSESMHTDDQINRLLELKERGLKNVYMLWDNEKPALLAAIKACKRIIRYGLKAHLAVLQDAKDPGEATPEQIMKAIRNAHPITSDLQAMLLTRKLTA